MKKIRYEVSKFTKLGVLFASHDQREALKVARECAKQEGEDLALSQIITENGKVERHLVSVNVDGTWTAIN